MTLLFSRADAAKELSMSPDHFDRYVVPHIRHIYSGRKRLVPASELERFVREQARFAG